MIGCMQVIRVHQTGGPERMVVDTLPDPTAGAGQAVVRVEAAGVNFIDVYHRTGLYEAPKPIAIGREGAGVVESVGEGAGVSVGDRVAWVGVPGSYATHVVVPAERLVPVPDGVDTRTAAAVLLQGMTAHYLATSTYPLAEGDTCLVHAAAGGVGLLLCQLARRAGARVIGTVSTEKKEERAIEAGASIVIRYTEQNFVTEVKNVTATRGIEVVYDSVGQSTFEGSLDCLAPRGMLVLYGQSSGPVPPFDVQWLNRRGSLYLTRPTLWDYVATRDELLERAGAVFGLVASGELSVAIDRALPLSEAPEAHRLLEGRKTIGKLVLEPTAD